MQKMRAANKCLPLDPVHELRSQSGWPQSCDDLTILNPGLLKNKDVGHGDDVAFIPLISVMLTILREPYAHALLMDNQVNSRRSYQNGTVRSMPAMSVMVSRRARVSRGH